MADTIILMDKGKIQQEASPEVIYRDPNNIFTARFIGTPPMNVLPVPGADFFVGYRPERIRLGTGKAQDAYSRQARVLTREMMGAETFYKLRIEEEGLPETSRTIMARSDEALFAVDDEVFINVSPDNLYLFGSDQQRIRPDDGSNNNNSNDGSSYSQIIRLVCR